MTRKENFKNKRNEMKNSVLNDCKEDLILISKYILKVYKRYNKLGKYLNICIMDDAIMINNEYYNNDKDFPIVIFLRGQRIMSLITFIDRILTENNMLQYAVEDVKEYVFEKAKEEANGESSIVIDDETVKKWVLDYTPDKKVEVKTVKTNTKSGHEVYDFEAKKPREKIVSKKEKSNMEGSWGHQESLF